MTTIAYKDGVIAYDSRATRNSFISSDSVDKCARADGVLFFFCGRISDVKHLVDCYLKGAQPPKHADIAGLVLDKGKVYRAGIDDGEFWVEDAEDCEAMGSGYQFAITAMDMGADAKTAVKMAAKRDTGTGGRIRTFKVKQ